MKGTAETEKKFEQITEDKNTINIDHIAETKHSVCQYCQKKFLLNNQLHKHIWDDYSATKNLNLIFLLSKKNPDTVSLFSSSKFKLSSKSVTLILTVSTKTTSVYIKSSAVNVIFINEYRFWNWHYATANAQFICNRTISSVCFNTDCIMTFIDQQFLKKQLLNTVIQQMPLLITV